MTVLGRDADLARLESWLALDVDRAEPAAILLVLDGEAGIGKTTLWTEAVRRAGQAGWTVLACRPARSDAGLSHVALADLLGKVPAEAVAALPAPQRRSLGVALLREEAGEGDLEPRAVGTGLTGLLGRLACAAPLLLAVDDAQWLDRASARALQFALRRLADRHVRMLASVRTDGTSRVTSAAFSAIELAVGGSNIARLPVGPLNVAATHQMFLAAIGSSFARPVLVRIHTAAGGNPFYALEIAREIGRLGVPPTGQPLPIPGSQRDLALLRLSRLPAATRDVLAVVAATSRHDARGLDLAALGPAERAGIVRVRPGGSVEFTHPLFASALYTALPEAARRALHRALAARSENLEERARHLALAGSGPDAETAEVLDGAADAAAARGAADAAVELKELARRLTPPDDVPSAVRRDLELADRRYFAGDPKGARRDLERSVRSLPAGEDRAQVLLALGSIMWTQCESAEGHALLLQALGEATARAMRARIHARISALAEDTEVAVEHGEAALSLLDETADPLLYSFSLQNLALWRMYAGHGADQDAIERGMQLQRQAATWETSTVPAFWARNLDDFSTARARFEELLNAFAERGDEAGGCGLLAHLALVEAMSGRMNRGRELAAQAVDLAEQTEQVTYLLVALHAKAQVCALAGELDKARRTGEQILAELTELPDEVLECQARAVLGATAFAAGDLAEADRQFSRADEIERFQHAREPASSRYHGDYIEALIGLGELDRAAELAARVAARAVAMPRPWTMVIAARAAGLLNVARGDLPAAMTDYQRALTAHESLEMPIELGRTLLSMGRLYRRINERQHAEAALAQAAKAFTAAGALGWAASATDELERAGARRGSPDRLTPTELEIARRAAAGQRNLEIAAQLLLSVKTVEANLSRAYRKLGVRSRTELGRRLADDPDQVWGRPAC